MRGRLSVNWIWQNVYSADYHWLVKDFTNLCYKCEYEHSLLEPALQWRSPAFQAIKMDDPKYTAKINNVRYSFNEFVDYTKENGQVGEITLSNLGEHVTLDNGHHRLYIAWLLNEDYVRVIIVGNHNTIPEEAFEPNSINSDYLYI